MTGPFCTNQPKDDCDDCTLNAHLMCRYDRRDTLHFFMIILPFFVSSVGGVITAGFGWWLFGWLAYMLFFFFCLGGAGAVQSLSLLGRGRPHPALSTPITA